LTAYALVNSNQTERLAVEARLAESHDARRAVEEIVQTADLLARELAAEPAPRLSAEQRAVIESEAELMPANVVRVPFGAAPLLDGALRERPASRLVPFTAAAVFNARRIPLRATVRLEQGSAVTT
jgi:anti-sigma factor RsiW